MSTVTGSTGNSLTSRERNHFSEESKIKPLKLSFTQKLDSDPSILKPFTQKSSIVPPINIDKGNALHFPHSLISS